jgi:hypothetical protein
MRVPVVVVCTLIALAVAPAARADVTIGSSLATDPNGAVSCVAGGGCTFSSVTIPGRQTTAPAAGVITRWRIRTGGVVTPVALQVVRRALPASQAGTEVGRSARVTPPVNATTPYPTRIPIEAGDYIGIECCATDSGFFFATNPGAALDGWVPPLGATSQDPFDAGASELLVNADIEPDADSDGWGDESQDDCLGVSGPDSGCPAPAPPPPPPASPAPKPPVVRFRTPLAGTGIGPSQRIELDVADDSGDPVVSVFDEDGTVCVLRAAPYTCTWSPTGADVGRATLLASAVDAGGLSTLAIVRVRVNRFSAPLTRKVRRQGRRTRVSGRLRLPAAVEPRLGCRGNVTVRIRRVRRTIALTRGCTYAAQLRVRTGRPRVSFAGNSVVAPTR